MGVLPCSPRSRGCSLHERGPLAAFEVLPAPAGLFQAHGYRAQVHPATLFVRRDLLLLAIGGWMALLTPEDAGLLLALNAAVPGRFTRESDLLHRKWEGQATAQPSHTDAAEREARMAVVQARTTALAHFARTRADAAGRADRP